MSYKAHDLFHGNEFKHQYKFGYADAFSDGDDLLNYPMDIVPNRVDSDSYVNFYHCNPVEVVVSFFDDEMDGFNSAVCKSDQSYLYGRASGYYDALKRNKEYWWSPNKMHFESKKKY